MRGKPVCLRDPTAEESSAVEDLGRWVDNMFIERLWRSLKYECVHLHAFETGSELRAGLAKWTGYYCLASEHPSGYVVENDRLC
jgi:transposase InsO family protein